MTYVPQGYPLFFGGAYMAGDADVKARNRNCQHRPGIDELEVSRILAWEIRGEGLSSPHTTGTFTGTGRGFDYRLFDTESEAKESVKKYRQILQKYWEAHQACSDTEPCKADPNSPGVRFTNFGDFYDQVFTAPAPYPYDTPRHRFIEDTDDAAKRCARCGHAAAHKYHRKQDES